MSKALAFVASGRARSTAAADAASKVLQGVGWSIRPVALSAASASDGKVLLAGPLSRVEVVSLGKQLGTALHSTTTFTAPSSTLNPDATYADAKFAFVRGNLPDPADVAVSYKDRVDKYPKNGIAAADETAYVKDLAAKTAAVAVTIAQQAQLAKVTLLQKPMSGLAVINGIYADALKKAAVKAVSEAAPTGLSVEVLTSAQAVNAAVMLSKTLGVVVAPDYSAGETFEGIAIGVAGGAGMAAQKHSGDGFSVYAQAGGDVVHGQPVNGSCDPGANPTGLLLAAAGALRESEDAAGAAKIEAALTKVFGAKTATKDVLGGKVDAAAFGDAVAKAL